MMSRLEGLHMLLEGDASDMSDVHLLHHAFFSVGK